MGYANASDRTLTGQAYINTKPALSERLFAAIAHILTLFSLLGMVLAAVIWLTQRQRSAYVSTQAREAVRWQIIAHIVVIVMIAVLVVIAIVTFGTALGTDGQAGQASGIGFLGALAGLYILPIVAAAIFSLISIFGAIQALLGRNYRYPGSRAD